MKKLMNYSYSQIKQNFYKEKYMNNTKLLAYIGLLYFGSSVSTFGAGESYYNCPAITAITWTDMTPKKGKNQMHLWQVTVPGGFTIDFTQVKALNSPTFSPTIQVSVEPIDGAGTPDRMTCLYTMANTQANPVYETGPLKHHLNLITHWPIQLQLAESGCDVDTQSKKARVRCP